jgi:hypothetical protein
LNDIGRNSLLGNRENSKFFNEDVHLLLYLPLWFYRTRFLDPTSQTHIFESLVTIFWVNSTIFLCQLAQIFSVPVQNKIIRLNNNFFNPLFCCCWIRDLRSGFRDQGSGMDKNQDLGCLSWIPVPNNAYVCLLAFASLRLFA